jgi:hypothetical protein
MFEQQVRLLHEYEEKFKSGVLSLAGREAYEQIVTRSGGDSIFTTL